MQRALEINEKHFGPDHPIVATGLNNLAWLLVPLHAIRGGFLTVITTDVLNGIGVLAGFKCLLVKCWEFGRVLGAGGRKPPWPADAGSGVERA